MKYLCGLSFALLVHCTLCGCSSSAPENAKSPQAQGKEEKIQKVLAELKPEDRKLAESQKFCAVSKQRLGTMGAPIKKTINGQAVFLCCAHCEEELKRHPEETLKRAQDLAAANK